MYALLEIILKLTLATPTKPFTCRYIIMASLEVPNSSGTDDLLARLIGNSDKMETNVGNNGAIISRKGTIRGVQDNVKNTVQNFKKMKVKPDASPMLRRVMEVSINDA